MDIKFGGRKIKLNFEDELFVDENFKIPGYTFWQKIKICGINLK